MTYSKRILRRLIERSFFGFLDCFAGYFGGTFGEADFVVAAVAEKRHRKAHLLVAMGIS